MQCARQAGGSWRPARPPPGMSLPHATNPSVTCRPWEVKAATRTVQVLLEPCVHDFDREWRGGQGLRCDGAPAVEVQCRWRDASHITEAFSLRKPERGSALSEAAQRAFGSLAVVQPM